MGVDVKGPATFGDCEDDGCDAGMGPTTMGIKREGGIVGIADAEPEKFDSLGWPVGNAGWDLDALESGADARVPGTASWEVEAFDFRGVGNAGPKLACGDVKVDAGCVSGAEIRGGGRSAPVGSPLTLRFNGGCRIDAPPLSFFLPVLPSLAADPSCNFPA